MCGLSGWSRTELQKVEIRWFKYGKMFFYVNINSRHLGSLQPWANFIKLVFHSITIYQHVIIPHIFSHGISGCAKKNNTFFTFKLFWLHLSCLFRRINFWLPLLLTFQFWCVLFFVTTERNIIFSAISSDQQLNEMNHACMKRMWKLISINSDVLKIDCRPFGESHD